MTDPAFEEVIKQVLDEYGQIPDKRSLVVMEKQKIIDSILTIEQKAQLEEIDFEFSEKEKQVDEEEKLLKKKLDRMVEKYAQSLELGNEKYIVSSKFANISFSDGGVEWDASGVDGYALTHPELLGFRKQLPPKTRITRKKM